MTEDETVQVKTRVPASQRDLWDEHAEELGVSRSQFLREMVQAGRRGFTGENVEEPGETPPNPGGDGLESRVLAILRANGARSWEQLREELIADLEADLEEALDALQSRDRVRYSGREGGYVLVDE